MTDPQQQDPPTAEPQTGVPEALPDLINLASGKELNEIAALNLASSRPVRLIVLAGEVDSGKTTLLTTLYELFQNGPVGGQNFAGSLTLPAFEERCHLGRTASQNSDSDTVRTVYKADPYYLHFRTRSVSAPHTFTDLLFTDVSGEMFEHACNSMAECRELRFLNRAAHFVLLLDGEKAVRPEKWGMIQNGTMLLRSCLDAEMLPKFCRVTIVWAKCDYFEAKDDQSEENHKRFREDATRQFVNAFKSRVGHLKFSEIAARPKRAPQLGIGNGVPGLFVDWITHGPEKRKMELQSADFNGTRESELFGPRYFASIEKS